MNLTLIALLGATIFTALIALLVAVGAYALAKETSERMDDIWEDLVDGELDYFLNGDDQ